MSLEFDPTSDEPHGDASHQRLAAVLSAAVDGETAALDAACSAWRDDAQARSIWHRYHLIGDVMRSSELAAEPAHDAAFLARLRLQLVAEPVVLAPQAALPERAAAASARAGLRWLMPVAAAAGFVAVAGVLIVSRLSAPDGADGGGGGGTGPVLAAAPSPSSALARVNGLAPAPAAAPRLQADDNLLRDPRVDEYLRAHQAARGGIPMAVPGGGLRRVDAEMQPGPSR